MLVREAEQLDAELAAQARAEAPLRLRLGQALEVLSRGGHCELGFSSIGAYARERCERGMRWVEATRCLARRLEALPLMREAVAYGQLSWSMAEVVARVAKPADEAHWLRAAEGRTVRKMRVLARDALGERAGGGDAAETEAEAEAEAGSLESDDSEDVCTLTCTVDQEELWLFEATRALLDHLGARSAEEQIEALLGEGQATLIDTLPRGTLEPEEWDQAYRAQRRRREELNRWRAEAEAACEGACRIGSGAVSDEADVGHGAVALAAASGCGTLEGAAGHTLDDLARELSQALSQHELTLAQLLLRFHRASTGGGGWRQLGYATESQYARERLGMSRSSMLARRALGGRLARLPRVAEALGSAEIGVEAALLLSRVATVLTQEAWVERARRRTIKHLHEEVTAALTAVRVSGDADCPPPEDAEIEAFHELERAVVSGRACRAQPAASPEPTRDEPSGAAEANGGRGRAWRVALESLGRWLEGGIQMSAVGASGVPGADRPRPSSAGRVTLRLRVSRALYIWWRGLEAQARGWLPRGMSWLRFLCLSVWKPWQHLLGPDVAYGSIYSRDRHRCRSPVCPRRDVTPHHLELRSAGGSDHEINVAALCTWCHLFGVHGGRIRATGTAKRIRWELGRPDRPCVVVDGRDRLSFRR